MVCTEHSNKSRGKMFKIFVAMLTTMVLLCSTVSVSAVSLRQEGVTESIHAHPTMNWLEMAKQMVVPSPPTLPIFEPIKAMEPPKLSEITGDLSHRSLQTVVSGPGSVTTGYYVVGVAYGTSDTQCTGPFTVGYAYVLGICIAPSGSTSGIIFTSDVRYVHLFFSKVSL